MTILYSLTLLSLLTHIQLNLIGTRKYVQSVRALAKQQQEEQSSPSSVGSLFWGTEPAFAPKNEDEDDDDDDLMGGDELDLERKYLTMSWWLLNIGWKDVAERVRSAVEAVFQRLVIPWELFIPKHPG